MVVNYRNRYGDTYTFTKQEDGNVLWEGDFEFIRSGDDFIDPSVEGFINTEKGILIQTKPHEVDSEYFRHLEDKDMIGGII